MDASIDSDAVALWQDALDLLVEENQPEAFIAMLRTCTPVKVEEDTLYAETPMRLAYNRILKNLPIVERCLSAAAFEDIILSLTLTKSSTPVTTTSTMTPQEFNAWKQKTAPLQAVVPEQIQDFESQEQSLEELKQQTLKRRKSNPLCEETSFNSTLTFDRFVVGDENELAHQHALNVANDAKGKANPLFIYGASGLGKTHLLRAVQNYINSEDILMFLLLTTSKNLLVKQVLLTSSSIFLTLSLIEANKSFLPQIEPRHSLVWDLTVLMIVLLLV